MKKMKFVVTILYLVFSCSIFVRELPAQGYGGPLTFQGVNHYLLHSVAGRAMGGISVGVKQDIGLMFQNPAALKSIDGIQFSLGGMTNSTDLQQVQNYAPVRYYSNLSLLLEGLTGPIPDPDTALVGFTAQDTVQRPYDDIGPNWSRSDNQQLPIQAMLAVPVSSGNLKLVAGAGAVKYADLNHYYQNNNVLSPDILTQRPLPTFRPTDDNPVEVEWSQSLRSREGSINGYGFSLTGSMEKYNVALGVSAMLLNGSSDDFEQKIARGNLTFFSNAFRLDSVYGKWTRTGTSEYSGQEFTVSGLISGRYATLGLVVKLPMTITRTYTGQIIADTMGVVSSDAFHGEDKLKLPWRGTVGLALTPQERLTVGLEYEYRPYGSVRYVESDGTETSPWLASSLFRIGVQYDLAEWLALRGGMRGAAEIFEPEGNHLPGEPVTYTVYAGGIGLSYLGAHLNLTYEYDNIKYEDIWATAISRNQQTHHALLAQIIYQIPWRP